MISASKSEIYFFEELLPIIGTVKSYEWLQSQSACSKSIGNSEVGRQRRWTHPATKDSDSASQQESTQCNRNVCNNETNWQLRTKQAETWTITPVRKVQKTTVSQISWSRSSPDLSRKSNASSHHHERKALSVSLDETELALLFTDAAHIVLDRYP
jgi:hypothetical protein